MSEQAAQMVDTYTSLSASYEQSRLTPYMQLIEGLERAIIAEEANNVSAKRILEIGCGTGRFSEYLAQLGYRVHALDIVPAMLDRARALRGHVPAVSWTNASAELLPFKDASFELVVALKVLPHVLDLASALADITRVLRDDGRAVLEFYNPFSLGSVSRRYDFFTRWLTPSQVKDWIERSGLRIVSRRGVRTVVPYGGLMEVPLIRGVLARLERRLSSSPLSKFASYYIVTVKVG